MTQKTVKETFEKCAVEYDNFIAKLIPYYHDQHKIIIDYIPFENQSKIKILDLGLGTGVISKAILNEYPNAILHGIDLSQKMIDVCEFKFKDCLNRVSLEQNKIEDADFGFDYDLVVSGLAIHHLDDEGQKNMFKKIYQSLKGGGVFINRDLVKSESDSMNEIFEKQWHAFEKSNGIDPEELHRNAHHDNPLTLNQHINGLIQAGFKDADCVFKYNNFGVFVGLK